MEELERFAHRQILKYAVGATMFCKVCKCIMDVKRAVNVEVSRDKETHACFTVCTKCFDSRKETIERVALDRGCSVEIIDGRELFKRKKRQS